MKNVTNIIMASPIFEEVTGMLLAVMSRLQTYFSARYIRKKEPVPKKKTGAVLRQQEVSDPEKKRKVRQRCCFVR